MPARPAGRRKATRVTLVAVRAHRVGRGIACRTSDWLEMPHEQDAWPPWGMRRVVRGAGRRPTGRAWLAVVVAGVAVAGRAPTLWRSRIRPSEREWTRLGPAVGRGLSSACRPARLASHLVHAAASELTAHDRGDGACPQYRDRRGRARPHLKCLGSEGGYGAPTPQLWGASSRSNPNLRPDTSMGTECGQVDAVQEGAEQPAVPRRGVLVLVVAVDCLHPRSPGYVVSVSYRNGTPRASNHSPQRPSRGGGLRGRSSAARRHSLFVDGAPAHETLEPAGLSRRVAELGAGHTGTCPGAQAIPVPSGRSLRLRVKSCGA